jgi:hypothetical protein
MNGEDAFYLYPNVVKAEDAADPSLAFSYA